MPIYAATKSMGRCCRRALAHLYLGLGVLKTHTDSGNSWVSESVTTMTGLFMASMTPTVSTSLENDLDDSLATSTVAIFFGLLLKKLIWHQSSASSLEVMAPNDSTILAEPKKAVANSCSSDTKSITSNPFSSHFFASSNAQASIL